MANANPLLPRKVNTNVSAENLPPEVCRYIKNLTLKKGANGTYSTAIGLNEEKLHPLQSNAVYAALNAPSGTNYRIGSRYFDTVNRVYVFCCNSEGNHFVYRINCGFGTLEIVKIDPLFNFQLQPQYFIHETGIWVEPIQLVDPVTGSVTTKDDLYFTDGFNPPRYLRVEDCIATNGFDGSIYPYFSGTYFNPQILISAGLPTLDNCIGVSEIPLTSTDDSLNNDLLFETWKFRVQAVDVFGRPTEHGIIVFYVPGINDCLGSSDNIPRCLNLVITVDNPLIDYINVEYLNDNGTTWYLTETIYLFVGDNVNNWWLRQRNPSVNYNAATQQVTTQFCADGQHQALDQTETSRLDNPIPQVCQAIVKLNQILAFLNNTSEFNPFTQAQKNAFSFNIIPPTQSEANNLVTIDIFIPIFNPYYNNYQEIQKNIGTGYEYIWGYNSPNHSKAADYLQYYNTPQAGHYLYLNDGDSVIGVQYYLNGNGQWVEDVDYNGIALSPTGMTAQRFTFTNKLAGNYVARLSGQGVGKNNNATATLQSTSTTVWGLCPYTISTVNGIVRYNINAAGREDSQELFINACNGNYSTVTDNKILLIADLSYYDENAIVAQADKATSGYIFETQNNSNATPENPMELILVTEPAEGIGSVTQVCNITDHNGFYWFSTAGTGKTFTFKFMYKCAFHTFNTHEGGAGMNNPNGNPVNYFMDEIPTGATPVYPDYATVPCNRIEITGKAVLAGTNIGISNASVMLTRGGSATTDDNGNFTIIAHDDMSFNGAGNIPPYTRIDNLIFSSVCIYKTTGGGCVPFLLVEILPCSSCTERTLNAGTWELTYQNFRGLLSGGNYNIGACGADFLSRRDNVQFLEALKIPTVAQTGIIAPSTIQVNIAQGTVFSTEFEYITLFITPELSNADFVEWIVGEVDFIDNTGNINLTNPSQIRVWYNSLLEYNKQNNFSTTCAWNFIVQGTTNPVVGDTVQFIINGNGQIYNTPIISLVKYDSGGQYFLIDYKSSLANLQTTAKFRLCHPNQSYSVEQPYYEICDSRINLKNGIPDRYQFTLNVYDTYYLSRQIPVPSSVNNLTQQVTNSTATQTGSITTTVETTSTQPVAYVNVLKTLGYYFEHHSPSNFWGSHCNPIIGSRVNVINLQEAQQQNFNQAALSGQSLANNTLNYLQYFDSALFINFAVPNTGGIIGALVMPGKVLWLTQHYNFVTGYNDNLLRQQADGTISANPANAFGQPETIIDYKYGCLLQDKNTIFSKNNKIIFVDRTLGELVGLTPAANSAMHFTKDAHDLFFNDKIRSMIGTNRYFTQGYSPLTDEYFLTDFNLDTISYINLERWYDATSNETMSFDINTGDFLGHTSFTPEGYSYSDGDVLNKQMFSFQNGVPFAHFNINENTSFNTFFGVICPRVLVIVANQNYFKLKSWNWIEVYCKFLYWSDYIYSETGQTSRLLISQWKRTNKFYKAAFLNDIATPDVNNIYPVSQNIFSGNKLQGRFLVIRLIGQSVNDNQYSELAGVIVFGAPLEKSGVK